MNGWLVLVVADGNIIQSGLWREGVLPLLPPLVAIIIPSILFYVIPSRQNRRKAAIDFFNAFFAEDMRRTRLEAWTYFVTDRKQLSELEQVQRLVDYVLYATRGDVERASRADVVGRFHQASRVLYYFALVNTCLKRGMVDRSMIKASLAWYYLWWRDEVMVPLRRVHSGRSDNPKYSPIWLADLRALDDLCGVPA